MNPDNTVLYERSNQKRPDCMISLILNVQKRQIYIDRKYINGCQKQGWEYGEWGWGVSRERGAAREIWGVNANGYGFFLGYNKDVLKSTVVMVVQFHEFTKTH